MLPGSDWAPPPSCEDDATNDWSWRSLASRANRRSSTLILCIVLAGTAACAALVEGPFGDDPIEIAVHAGLMLLAWGILLPLGAVTARYYKVMPGQDYPRETNNLFWWHWHRALQVAGVAAATAALAAVATETRAGFSTWHGRLGLVVLVVAWAQVASSFVRGTRGGPPPGGLHTSDPRTWRGDHYDMTRRRRLFEAWHKSVGWGVLVAAAVVVLLGLDLIGAPDWLVAAVGALQGAAVVAVIDGRLRGRWVATYHALWGPDPIHPGNRDPVVPPPCGPTRPSRVLRQLSKGGYGNDDGAGAQRVID